MRTVTCTVAIALAATSAYAQHDFSGIKAKIGQQMIVTEGGLSVTGALTELTPASLKVDDREFTPGPGLKVERDNGNTVGRGAKVGAAAGALLGLVAGRGVDRLAAAWFMMLPGAFWGAIGGLTMDRRVTLYDTTAAAEAAIPQIEVPSAPAIGTVQDFHRLRVKPGDMMFINDGGVMLDGLVTEAEPDHLTVGTRTFSPHADLRIEKRGDPIWDGAAIGFGAGALLGSTAGAEGCLTEPLWHCALQSGVGFGAIGALIDWAHKGRTTVYDTSSHRVESVAWRVAPIVTTHERGVTLSFNVR